jgi:hypothetical protein
MILVQGLALDGFVVSLSMPAFLFDGFPKDMTGWDVLLSGWLGLIILDPRWCANVLFAACVVASLAGRSLRWVAIVGLLFVIASVVLPITYFPNDHGERVEHLGPGVLVWALSLGTAFVSNLWVSMAGRARSAVPTATRPALSKKLAVLAALALPVGIFVFVKPRLFPEQTAYAEGCRGAYVQILERIPPQTVVALVPDRFPHHGSTLGTSWDPIGEWLVARTELEAVERPPSARIDRAPVDTPFETVTVDGPVITDWAPGKPSTRFAYQPLAAPTATYEVVATNLAPRGYESPYYGGADIQVRERGNPRHVVARAHYFWREQGGAGCPQEAAGGDFAWRFVEKVLGLHEREDTPRD